MKAIALSLAVTVLSGIAGPFLVLAGTDSDPLQIWGEDRSPDPWRRHERLDRRYDRHRDNLRPVERERLRFQRR